MSSQNLLPANLQVIKSVEVSGFPIEVGVLRDGTPFLSGRGLARACGISNSTLVGWGEIVPSLGDKNRAGKIAKLLATYGYQSDRFFVRIVDSTKFGGKASISAYPYQVCMAFLDYYAFEASKETARNSLRVLSEKQLPQFIYEAIGYSSLAVAKTPLTSASDRPYTFVPEGYFSISQATARGKIHSVQTTLNFDTQTTTYLNLEKAWNHHWDIHKLWEHYGQHIAYLPLKDRYLPQAAVSKAIKTYVYPISALGEFKEWLNWQYIPERFPSYLHRKRHQHNLSGISSKALSKAG